jgi:hypothetical protein
MTILVRMIALCKLLGALIRLFTIQSIYAILEKEFAKERFQEAPQDEHFS